MSQYRPQVTESSPDKESKVEEEIEDEGYGEDDFESPEKVEEQIIEERKDVNEHISNPADIKPVPTTGK